MRVVCSYCRVELARKEPLDDDGITHTMCPECLDHFGKQAEGWSLGELLDQFEVPVLAVDFEGRAIAANQSLADMMGRSRRELFGLLGGELMECAYAPLPGGCGETVHCKACTVRKTVTETIETGESLLRVPAFVDRQGERIEMLISTNQIPSGVVLIVEEATMMPHEGGLSARTVPSDE